VTEKGDKGKNLGVIVVQTKQGKREKTGSGLGGGLTEAGKTLFGKRRGLQTRGGRSQKKERSQSVGTKKRCQAQQSRKGSDRVSGVDKKRGGTWGGDI